MKAVIAVISDLSTDMRVRKLAMLLAEERVEVTMLGRWSPVAVPETNGGIRISRIRLPFRKGPLMYIMFNILLFFRLLFSRFDICVASDLDTLVPCYLVSRLSGKSLIYDSHEYFTGQHGLQNRRVKHFVWKSLERLIVPRIRHMITVSDSIADLYRSEYGTEPVVVRNVSPDVSRLKPHDRHEPGVPEGELLIVYQGSGINPGRGTDELIGAMAMTKGVWLLIIGSGDAMDSLRKDAGESPASDRIIFLPRMPWEEMMRYTLACDAGLSLDTDTCINQRYSLPNKLFDYIAAGIPVVVSPLPEVSALVKQYGCGIILDEVSPEAISRALMKLSGDRQLLLSLRQRAAEATKDLTWEKEKVKEQELIRSVITSKSPE